MYEAIWHFLSLWWHGLSKSIRMEDKNLFILHSQCHGYWSPGNARIQAISSHDIDIVVLLEHFSFSTLRFNSSPPSVAYMHRWTGSTLFQIMAWRRDGAKPLSKPMLKYCWLDPWEQTSVKSQSKFRHFHSRKCIGKCRLKNGGHVSSSSMCEWGDIYSEAQVECALRHEMRVVSLVEMRRRGRPGVTALTGWWWVVPISALPGNNGTGLGGLTLLGWSFKGSFWDSDKNMFQYTNYL